MASERREPKAEGACHQPRGRPPGPPGVSERADGKFPPQAHQPLNTSMGQSPWQLHPVLLWALLVAVTHEFIQRGEEPEPDAFKILGKKGHQCTNVLLGSQGH